MSTPASSTSALLAALLQSRVYDLGQPMFMGMPVHPTLPPFIFGLLRRHGDSVREGGYSGATEIMTLCCHVGTHFDGLGHISRNGMLHGGQPAATSMNDKGLKVLGMETVPPMVCRGVLLDVAGLKGVEALAPAEPVTADDLEACVREQGVQVEPGDAVLIRTGWIRHWENARLYTGQEGGTPGPDPSAARWLVDRQVKVTGNDTLAYEVFGPGINNQRVHADLLCEAGIHIVEALNLEDLAQDGVHSFAFVVCPLKLVGATGSPVRPIAIAL